MSRPHASSVDADNAWGPPPAVAEPEETFTAADVAAKEELVRCAPPAASNELSVRVIEYADRLLLAVTS